MRHPPQVTLSTTLIIAIGSGGVLVVSFIGILLIVLIRNRRKRRVKLPKSQMDEGYVVKYFYFSIVIYRVPINEKKKIHLESSNM